VPNEYLQIEKYFNIANQSVPYYLTSEAIAASIDSDTVDNMVGEWLLSNDTLLQEFVRQISSELSQFEVDAQGLVGFVLKRLLSKQRPAATFELPAQLMSSKSEYLFNQYQTNSSAPPTLLNYPKNLSTTLAGLIAGVMENFAASPN
jgi:hypothetical protein